jgi:hypothetical protein
MYDRADVVVEVTVEDVRRPLLTRRGRLLYTVKVEHAWKTDGGPLTAFESGEGGGDCTTRLFAGETYVIFASRVDRRSVLPWKNDSRPLYASLGQTFHPNEFKAWSPFHSRLYVARSRESLEQMLQELAR